MTKERNELQKLEKKICVEGRQKNSIVGEKKMRKGQPPDMLPVEAIQEEHSNFCNKMSKFRAVKKLKNVLPQMPVKKFATMKACLSSRKSPTVTELQKKELFHLPKTVKMLK